MTTCSNLKKRGLSGSVTFSSSFDRLLSLLRGTLLVCLLIGLVGLSGFSASPALAAPTPDSTSSQVVKPAAESERAIAFLACLPKQLSKPNLQRTLSEMGNDQAERILNLKADHKLSQAEAELKDCLNRKGFTN